jgi:hypothetical protein
VFIWGNSELYVESVIPDLFHIIPVLDDTVTDGVRNLQYSSLLLSFISDVFVLGFYSNDDTWVLGSSNDGREDSSGSIFTGETGLYDSGSIINNASGLFFCHVVVV